MEVGGGGGRGGPTVLSCLFVEARGVPGRVKGPSGVEAPAGEAGAEESPMKGETGEREGEASGVRASRASSGGRSVQVEGAGDMAGDA